MKLYNKSYGSCYEELINYYPTFYRNIYEMTELLKSQGEIADELEQRIEQTYLNCFIDYADEDTIHRLEVFLKLERNRKRSLEERRQLVKSYFVGFGKISASAVCRMIGICTDTDVSCRFEPYDKQQNHALFLCFGQDLPHTLYLSTLEQLLSRKLPAHIKYMAVFENVVDHRNLEKMFLRNVKLYTGIRFWDCHLFDGSFFMDGIVLFGQTRRYNLIPRIRCGISIFQNETGKVLFLLIRAAASAKEQIKSGAACHFKLIYWNQMFFNGSCLLNGNQLFCAVRGALRTALQIHINAESGTGRIGNTEVIVKRNPNFLDGSVKFDGSVIANAVYRKESIE